MLVCLTLAPTITATIPGSIQLLCLPGCCRFISETGLVDLMDLAADQQGRLRLTKAFPAVAKRCAALGRVEGAAALLALADEGRTEAAGGRGVLQPQGGIAALQVALPSPSIHRASSCRWLL